MESLKSLFKIGNGPSSSHTMGPRFAAEQFLDKNKNAARFEVTLYGSLAATGKGHLTDVAILDVLTPHADTTILWEPKIFLPFHPNGMKFKAFDSTGSLIDEWIIYSIGGGALANENSHNPDNNIYEMNTIKSIQEWCEKNGRTYWEYVEECEGSDIWDYLKEVWTVMKEAIDRGLEAEGVLPGGLGVRRKAAGFMEWHNIKGAGLCSVQS